MKIGVSSSLFTLYRMPLILFEIYIIKIFTRYTKLLIFFNGSCRNRRNCAGPTGYRTRPHGKGRALLFQSAPLFVSLTWIFPIKRPGLDWNTSTMAWTLCVGRVLPSLSIHFSLLVSFFFSCITNKNFFFLYHQQKKIFWLLPVLQTPPLKKIGSTSPSLFQNPWN